MAIKDAGDLPLADLISLRGRNAVITGAGKGLGFAIARRLGEAGANLLLGDIDLDSVTRAADELTGRFNIRAIPVQLDASKGETVVAAADRAVAEFGGIDIWVNNAGIYPNKPLVETSEDDWNRVLDINLRGTFVGCREAARCMDEKKGGVIVNLSSMAGVSGREARIAPYVASKHGVVGITKQVALELAERNIRVLAVAPTIIITPGVESAMAAHGDLEVALSTRLGRAGRPDDVARVVLFCASDLALFMTGSTLLVDAGDGAV